jgi:hypothetical protein
LGLCADRERQGYAWAECAPQHDQRGPESARMSVGQWVRPS